MYNIYFSFASESFQGQEGFRDLVFDTLEKAIAWIDNEVEGKEELQEDITCHNNWIQYEVYKDNDIENDPVYTSKYYYNYR